MKLNKKFLHIGILLIILQISISNITVFANNTSNNDILNMDSNKTNDNYFTSKRIFNETLNDTEGCELKTFNIYKDYPYFKVWINNTSEHTYIAVITKDNEVGKILGKFKINPHSKSSFNVLTEYYSDKNKNIIITKLPYDNNINSIPFETIVVSVTSESGYKLKGSMSVRISSNKNDLSSEED